MIKRKELTDPNSCLNRAKDDEMVFVLLGRDAAAPAAIIAWIEERIALKKNKPYDPQILEAIECVRRMGPSCRVCGCTNLDCRQCIEATGKPCSWAKGEDPPLCTRCVKKRKQRKKRSA